MGGIIRARFGGGTWSPGTKPPLHLDCHPLKAAAIPGPAWPHPAVPWGEFGAPLLGREIRDPYPEPQDLAAARVALGGRDPRELLQQDEEGDT